MKILKYWYLMFALGAGIPIFVGCGGSNPAGPSGSSGSSGPVVSVTVNNNTVYAIQMKMDSGAYVTIPGSSSQSFTSTVAGTHTFTQAAMLYVGINGSACSNAYTGTSNGLVLGATYTINISYCGSSSCTFVCGNGLITWGSPANTPTPTPAPTSTPGCGVVTCCPVTDNSPSGNSFVVGNATSCSLTFAVNYCTVGCPTNCIAVIGSCATTNHQYVLASGHYYYFNNAPAGTYTVYVSGCGYTATTSGVTADGTNTHGVNVSCSGSGYTYATY